MVWNGKSYRKVLGDSDRTALWARGRRENCLFSVYLGINKVIRKGKLGASRSRLQAVWLLPLWIPWRWIKNVHRKQNQNPVRKLKLYGKLQILSPTRKIEKQEMKGHERRRGEVGRDRVREGKEGERKKRQSEKPGWETTSQGIFGKNRSWKDCHLLYFGLLKPCYEGNGPTWLRAVHAVLALQAKGSQFWVPRTKVKNKTNNKVLMVA